MPKKKTEQLWEQQRGESAQAFEAFSCYLEMGADRSIRAVGQELGKSRALIERWSSTYNWVERVRAWDNHLQREARRAAVDEVREMNRRHTQLAIAIQGKVIKALNERGDSLITSRNMASIVKLVTELERDSRVAEVAALTDDLRKAEDEGDAVVKIICDIPRVQPTTPEEGEDDEQSNRSSPAQ